MYSLLCSIILSQMFLLVLGFASTTDQYGPSVGQSDAEEITSTERDVTETQYQAANLLLVGQKYYLPKYGIESVKIMDKTFRCIMSEAIMFCQSYPSCPGICGYTYYHSVGGCTCNSGCLKHGDCCLEYEQECLAGNDMASLFRRRGKREARSVESNACEETVPDQSPPYNKFFFKSRARELNNLYKCKSFNTSSEGKMSFLTVSHCPANEIQSMLEQYREDCHGPETSMEHATPVVANNILFKNRYCAYCHAGGLYDVSKALEPLAWNFNCSHNPLLYQKALDIGFQQDIQAMWEFLYSHCIAYVTFGHLDMIQGSCVPGVIDKCNATYKSILNNYYDVKDACETYTSYLMYAFENKSDAALLFKNYHCALCNGYFDTSNMFCFEPPQTIRGLVDFFPSLSILLDFNAKHQIKSNRVPICLKTRYLNPDTNKCISTACQNATEENGKSCIKFVDSLGLADQGKQYTVFITILPKYHTNDTDSLSDILQNALNDALKGLQNRFLSNFTVVSIKDSCRWIGLDSGQIKALQEKDRIGSWCATAMVHSLYLNLPGYLSNVLVLGHSYALPWVEMKNVLISSSKHPLNPLLCGQGPMQQYSDFILVEETSVYRGLGEPNIHLVFAKDNNTELLIPFSDTVVITEMIYETTKKEMVLTCRPRLLDCNKTIINKKTLGEMHMNALQMGVKFQYIELSQDRIAVCTEELVLIPKQSFLADASTSSTQETKTILSLVGNILSILGLVLTLTTYAMFSELRNLPGRQLICLMGALLFAQVLFMVSRMAASMSILCTIVAAAQHFAWLGAFFWINTIAVSISRNISTLEALEKKPSFLCRSLYAWGTPLLIVSVCLILDLKDVGNVQYGSIQVCWITGTLALILTFAVPVGLIILINLALFVTTVVTIFNISRNDAIQSTKEINQFKVCSKLWVLMGTTWVFGFLANIKNIGFLAYVFIVTNSLQGLFIFFSYGLTRRNIDLMKSLSSTISSKRQGSENRP